LMQQILVFGHTEFMTCWINLYLQIGQSTQLTTLSVDVAENIRYNNDYRHKLI